MPSVKTPKNKTDSLFTTVEQAMRDLRVGSGKRPFNWADKVEGLISAKGLQKELNLLKNLSVDAYIARVLEPAESTTMVSARNLVRMINGKTFSELDMGPLYSVEIALTTRRGVRRIGVLAQNRAVANGVWKPEHHLEAARLVRSFNHRNIPIVTLMDTPGADAGAEANEHNQAHSISRLIAEMTNVHVPTIGIVYGLGYSGGAIPLAATNILLAVRTGVFNTIQPKGLASIARQYNLSWQESARYVGISPAELTSRGVIDGVIDWSPNDAGISIEPLVNAITSSIFAIEDSSAALVESQPLVFDDYRTQVERFLNPDPNFVRLQKVANFKVEDFYTEYPNVFTHACRHLRYMAMRSRISSSTVDAYGRLAETEIPEGDLAARQAKARDEAFQSWYKDPEKLIYQEDLFKSWKHFKEKRSELSAERGRFTTLLLGDPQKNFEEARQQLCFRTTLYLYNRWKADGESNFSTLARMVRNESCANPKLYEKADNEVTLNEVIFHSDLRNYFLNQFENILIFNALYNSIVSNFGDIAAETREFHTLSADSLKKILDTSIDKATREVADNDAHDSLARRESQFARWLGEFVNYRRRGEFLKEVEEWKRIIYPRLSESLLVLITFFFESLVPEYLNSQLHGKTYEGRINPVRIGKRKDFWNQLNIAYRDLLVQKTLDVFKRKKLATVDAFKEKFFSEFDEVDGDLMTSDPVSFPGFRLSIEKALKAGIKPCGVVAGIGTLKIPGAHKVGVVISNVQFQAGAFDMASAEKMCDLMVICAQRKLPLVCFVSSGGMQTKEGANALFSMAIVNDRITRFVCETGLPVVVFGFGDCTGGSQASFVTHPLVQTYYLSGTDMPFAGRVVVPSFLPSMCTVSNYLAKNEGSMHGLVKHPFAEDLDAQLTAIDPDILIPKESIEDVLERTLAGRIETQSIEAAQPVAARDLMRPIEKVLIHARGCTAAKLIRIAKRMNINVVLVQSDPDMDSAPASLLGEGDELVCLGGQTPDESYLNARSVLAIASRTDVDSLHPGIGFLSENAGFARLCRKHNLNFIGPKAISMDVMGNKSNAIHTAMSNQVPVVPGSHGILTTAGAAARVAEQIGYPVLLKAVHGGGGKGIQVVRDPADIRSAFNRVFSEAKSAFGNGDLYLEKFVESMRHIEVQVLRDTHGNTKILGLRDCTVQRNNQKVVEESGSTMLPAALKKKAFAAAKKLADAVDYIGAGTVEFIFDLTDKTIYFMEMNTRLQVEHPVTEWTSGVQIVEQQYRIAQGESIEHLDPQDEGFSIEVRITAEKARLNDTGDFDFIPTPGLVTECRFPTRDDIEVISAVDDGKTISPFYDSMIAQLIVHAEDRNAAIAKMLEVLAEVSIKGVCTNIPLLKRILSDKTFVDGEYDTGYLPAFLRSIDAEQLVTEMAYTGVDSSGTSLDSLRIEGTQELKVLAPMTGIYYATPAPTEPDYVSVGDRIKLSAILCQIEAMKLFSQISLSSVLGAGEIFMADQTYEVVRLNQVNGAQVNSGDLLFVIRPVQ